MTKTVLIGIQARTGNLVLPRQAFELISGKTVLDRVIEAAKKAAPRINNARGGDLRAKIVVLTPKGDEVASEFRGRCDVMEGPEQDVLSRYMGAVMTHAPDWVVRITGDCPLLPPYIISKLVSMAYLNRYDYVSNVDERFRTALDGADCEVLSGRLIRWLDDEAVGPDREHVTTLARRSPPSWAKVGTVVHHFDHSGEKLSVDTPEDLERVRKAFERADEKWREAVLKFGSTQVHRI